MGIQVPNIWIMKATSYRTLTFLVSNELIKYDNLKQHFDYYCKWNWNFIVCLTILNLLYFSRLCSVSFLVIRIVHLLYNGPFNPKYLADLLSDFLVYNSLFFYIYYLYFQRQFLIFNFRRFIICFLKFSFLGMFLWGLLYSLILMNKNILNAFYFRCYMIP